MRSTVDDAFQTPVPAMRSPASSSLISASVSAASSPSRTTTPASASSASNLSTVASFVFFFFFLSSEGSKEPSPSASPSSVVFLGFFFFFLRSLNCSVRSATSWSSSPSAAGDEPGDRDRLVFACRQARCVGERTHAVALSGSVLGLLGAFKGNRLSRGLLLLQGGVESGSFLLHNQTGGRGRAAPTVPLLQACSPRCCCRP